MDFDLSTYFPIFLYVLFILAFAGVSLGATHLIGPRKKTPVKEMPYESGMDPVSDARQRFDVKFYLIAVVFLIFDVELLFLYPFAVAAYHDPAVLPPQMRGLIFGELLVFVATLIVAYVYAWKRGVFKWR